MITNRTKCKISLTKYALNLKHRVNKGEINLSACENLVKAFTNQPSYSTINKDKLSKEVFDEIFESTHET